MTIMYIRTDAIAGAKIAYPNLESQCHGSVGHWPSGDAAAARGISRIQYHKVMCASSDGRAKSVYVTGKFLCNTQKKKRELRVSHCYTK